MPWVLREVRKAKWYKSSSVPWLLPGELQAEALADLKTRDNQLSLWHVLDDKSNLQRVVAALAAGRDHVANFDYALLDAEVITDLALPCDATEGESLDAEANGLWHCDLRQLSASKLMQLAEAIQQQAEIKRIPPKQVANLIADSISADQLDRSRLSDSVLATVDSKSP